MTASDAVSEVQDRLQLYHGGYEFCVYRCKRFTGRLTSLLYVQLHLYFRYVAAAELLQINLQSSLRMHFKNFPI